MLLSLMMHTELLDTVEVYKGLQSLWSASTAGLADQSEQTPPDSSNT